MCGIGGNLCGCGAGISFCFAANDLVTLQNGQTKQMKDLKVGDKVLTINKNKQLVFDKVYGFLHREVDKDAKFLQIHLEGGRVLTLTSLHMLYKAVGNSQSVVPAYKISTGDRLFVVSENGIEIQAVSSITEIELKGIYAPVTYSGRIVVDGVLASCYAEHDNMDNQKIAHFSLAPLRLKSKVRLNKKKESERSGVNGYCNFLAVAVYPIYKTAVTAAA